MAFDKLTWVGLMIVALGWALLLSGTSAMEVMVRLTGHAAAPSLNLAAVTQATILTGFGLALLGALQTGFSTLKKLFDAGVENSIRSAPAMANEPSAAGAQKNYRARSFRDRPYVLFGDGTIEVKTLLGVRRFSSLLEAHEFIGG